MSRADVLRFRVHAQELDLEGARGDARILDIGVQETGPDGALWALEIRGSRPAVADLFQAWTLRGALGTGVGFFGVATGGTIVALTIVVIVYLAEDT